MNFIQAKHETIIRTIEKQQSIGMSVIRHLFSIFYNSKRTKLTIFFLIAYTVQIFAYDFKVDGIYYNVTGDNTCSVTYGLSNYSGDVTIPESVTYNDIDYAVTAIGEDAFNECGYLTSVIISDSVISIGDYAFSDCSRLTSVIIGNSVTTIGIYAFANCKKIISLTIGKSVTTIGQEAFLSCTGLTSLTIPNSVTEIGPCAFYDCTGLISVTLGNSLTTIGVGVFSGCSGLHSVDIPNSVITIGDGAFRGCSSLSSVTIGNSVATIGESAFWGCSGLSSVAIPNSVTTIGNSAFRECNGLTSIIIGNSVVEVGDNAFKACGSLNSVIIGDSVAKIGNDAFYGCAGMTSISIPDSVTKIGENAFKNCKGLTSITLGNSVAEIGENAFYSCTGLISMVLPNSLEKINTETFRGCSAMTSVIIGNSVAEIGQSAFRDCSNLASITIGSSVAKIDIGAFKGCNLQCIESLPTTPPELKDNPFDNYTPVLIAASEKYKTRNGWKAFSSIIIGYTPTSASFEVNGLKYDIISISDLTCRLYKISDEKSGDIVVPQTVTYKDRKFNVNEICGVIVKSRTDVSSIVIPSGIAISNTLIVNSTLESLSIASNISDKVAYKTRIEELIIKPEVSEFNFDNVNTVDIGKITIEDSKNELYITDSSVYDKRTELYFGRPMNFTEVSFPAVETVSFGKYISSINSGSFKNDTAIRIVNVYNTIPPTTEDTFSNETYFAGVLNVPESAIDIFATARGWKDFWEIKALDNKDAINAIYTDNCTSFNIVDGTLNIVGNALVRIVAINGTVVYSGYGDRSIKLNKGMYIIVFGDKASKVVVE